MPEQIEKQLESAPQDLKAVFNMVQGSEEAEDLENGDYIALYNSDAQNLNRNEHRWIRIGVYDEEENAVETEYFLHYETSTRKLGAELNFNSRSLDDTDGRRVVLSDFMYEKGLDTIHELL